MTLPDMETAPRPFTAIQGMKLPEALVAFASTVAGDYRSRYQRILERAFSEYFLLLNAKQLRELAGGGSQGTAQDEIDRFRDQMHARLRFRLTLDEDVPKSLSEGATTLFNELWALARGQALSHFDSERNQLGAKFEELTAAAEASQRQARGLAEQVQSLQAALQTAEEKLRHVAGERDAAREEVRTLGIQITELQRELKSAETRLLQAHDEAQRAAKAAAQRLDEMVRETRERLATTAREHSAEVTRLTGERDAAARERDKAREERATADIERARAEQRAAGAEEAVRAAQARTAAVEDQLAKAAAELKDAEQRSGVQTRQLEERLAAAERRAVAAESRVEALEWSAQQVSVRIAAEGASSDGKVAVAPTKARSSKRSSK